MSGKCQISVNFRTFDRTPPAPFIECIAPAEWRYKPSHDDSSCIGYNHAQGPMKFIRNTARNFGVAGELVSFFWTKRWWLVPLVVTLFVLIALIALAQSSAIAPFIYTLF